MKLCPECSRSPWPFVMVVFLSAFSAFLTWLTLVYSEQELLMRILGSATVFLLVGATLTHYVVDCMKRHCRHGKTHLHHHQRAT